MRETVTRDKQNSCRDVLFAFKRWEMQDQVTAEEKSLVVEVDPGKQMFALTVHESDRPGFLCMIH